MPTRTDREWMEQALALAAKGHGLASPNPLVGALLVRDAAVVGQGFHAYEGVKHAEALALEQAGARARGATLYTNLEPCTHTGRTAPCTDAILAAGVARVVAAMADPNPAVSGRGLERLRTAGVEVSVGVHEEEARHLNEAFACYVRTGLPQVTLKAALTLDGKIASNTEGHRWITSEESRAVVQTLRHQHDAVLTGVGTVRADDPLLTDRSGRPRRRPLLRVVLDTRLRMPLAAQLVRTAANDVVIFTSENASSDKQRELEARGVQVEFVPEAGGHLGLRAVLARLAARQLTSVLLEGGAHINANALAANVVDKVFLFYAPQFLGSNHSLPLLAGGRLLKSATRLHNYRLHRFGPDFAIEGYLHDVYGDH
ncbi:MAG: bifunctional diaminohydroxyphosphoribosylaminopyrimidine deaminase/5-amino-6-(5-phosphoribosylamino)uracil reductase RibD [Terriglobia bacterium]